MKVKDLVKLLKEKDQNALVMLDAGGSVQHSHYRPVGGLGTWSKETPDIIFIMTNEKTPHVSGALLEAGWRPPK